jgi:hypothetical protein
MGWSLKKCVWFRHFLHWAREFSLIYFLALQQYYFISNIWTRGQETRLLDSLCYSITYLIFEIWWNHLHSESLLPALKKETHGSSEWLRPPLALSISESKILDFFFASMIINQNSSHNSKVML